MTSYTDPFSLVTQLLIAGGGGAAIGAALFKYLGQRWLDNRFAKQQAELSAGFAERLQQLKADQDRSIRHVQSEIDRNIHRAKKLYDREFDVLSEAWALLCKAFDSAQLSDIDVAPDISGHTQEGLINLLAKIDAMPEHTKQELLVASALERSEKFRKWHAYTRLHKYSDEVRELRHCLKTGGIFMRPPVKEKFTAITELVDDAVSNFGFRLSSSVFKGDCVAAVEKLRSEGIPMRTQLEQLIHVRLWSASESAALEGPAA